MFAAKSLIFRIVLLLFSKHIFFNFEFNFDRALAPATARFTARAA